MRKILLLVMFALVASMSIAQEVLLPLQYEVLPQGKSVEVRTLPFFDDFSDMNVSQAQWGLGGALVNQGYAPLPPTIGMVTLDAYDANGNLYATELGQLYTADTLTSPIVRLDSAFVPYVRAVSAADSVYLSFFYLPGGGYGNMWERVGDVPESMDSLVLELYDAGANVWRKVWSCAGISADTLFARTGSYWQYQAVPIVGDAFFSSDFRFRFRSYCSLDNASKKGLLSNADQWNIDYVYVNLNRTAGDSTLRDMAFVSPAPSLLSHYHAMPYNQYRLDELKQNLDLVITNRFTEQLPYHYGYQITDERGNVLHDYDGGYENAPVYWDAYEYQTSQAHAHPELGYSFPYPMTNSESFLVTHGLKEGVSGDPYPANDTVVFRQEFADYFAYDDGTAENGYGISSTYPRVKLACAFPLNEEDTLTAVRLYFNKTYRNQNADVRFYITVWDDNNGRPGNVIYQDANRRSPNFEGLNRYVRYVLEKPIVVGQGTIYVGLEQTTADYINLGFDRNNDASNRIFYLSDTNWRTSILQGALMLRPYFRQSATLDIHDIVSDATVRVQGNSIVITQSCPQPISVFDIMGRLVYSVQRSTSVTTPTLNKGVYLVRAGTSPAKKVIIL